MARLVPFEYQELLLTLEEQARQKILAYGNLPGLNGYLEMQQLLRAGLSLEQIFRAATINNARASSSIHSSELSNRRKLRI